MRAFNLVCAAALLSTTALGGSSCSSCDGPSGGTVGVDAGAGPVAVEPPVPAPQGLLAEASLRAPDATWGRLQRGVGGAMALLPPTLGELVCGTLGLDSRLARLVDGKATSYIVLGVASAPAALAWVAALPLTDFGAASAILLGAGDAGGASPVARDVAGMRILPGSERPWAMTAALARGGHGWLVLASSEDDLARMGPYAIRTMPAQAAPEETAAVVAAIPASAMAGPLSSWLGAWWEQTRSWLAARDDEQRARHGGRAPDFGDPRPIMQALDGAMKRRVALLSHARDARITLEAGDDEVHAELRVTPGDDAASQLAAMAPGDARPLGQLPAETILATLVRDDPRSREEEAAEWTATLDKAVGGRLTEDDEHALHTALADWTHARGDWWTSALSWGEGDTSRGVWFRTPAAAPDPAIRAVRELVDLWHRPAPRDLLQATLHGTVGPVGSADAPPLGAVSLATFTEDARGRRKTDPSKSMGMAWTVQMGDLLVAAGASAPVLVATEAAPPARVADDPRCARALAALGDSATFAIFARPLRLEPARGGVGGDASAPAMLAWGRRGTVAWARLELADVLLRELIRLNAGL